jgi:hypothetical protein
LLYEEGFTISGARHRLESDDALPPLALGLVADVVDAAGAPRAASNSSGIRGELLAILDFLRN